MIEASRGLKNSFKTSIIICMLLLVQVTQHCFTTEYPSFFGGTTDNTIIRGFDLGPNGAMVMGGESMDPNFCTSGNLPVPFVVHIDATGLMRYAKQIVGGTTVTYDRVTAIKFSLNYNKVALVLDMPSNQALAILVMDLIYGNILLQFKETTRIGPLATIKQNGLVFDTSENLYLTYSLNSKFTVFKLPLLGGYSGTPISSSFLLQQSTSNSACGLGTSILIDSSSLYLSGIIWDSSTSSCTSNLMSLNPSDGSLQWILASHPTNPIIYESLYKITISSRNYMYLCGTQGTSTLNYDAYVGRIVIDSTPPNLSDPLNKRYVSSGATKPYACLAIAPALSTSSSSAFVFIKQLGSIQNMYMMKINFDTGVVKDYINDELTGQSGNQVYHAILPSLDWTAHNTYYYFGGTLMDIYVSGTGPLTGYSKYQGFVSKMTTQSITYTLNCLVDYTIVFSSNSDFNVATDVFTSQISTSLLVAQSTQLQFSQHTLSTIDVGNTSSAITNICHLSQPGVTITAPTLSAKTYDIGLGTGTLSYTFPAFSFSESCIASFMYTFSVSPATSLVYFDKNNRIVAWDPLITVGNYIITVIGYLGSGQQQQSTFTLSITNACPTSNVNTAGAISPITYTISQTSLSTTFTAFTCANPLCIINYQLIQSSGTALPPTLMTFNPSTRTLIIYNPSDNTLVSTYTLKLIGQVPGGLSNFVTFTVTVQHQCTLTIISPNPITQITYDISSSTPWLENLNWIAAIDSICPLPVYTLSMQDLSALDTAVFSVTSGTGLASNIQVSTSSSTKVKLYMMIVTCTVQTLTTIYKTAQINFNVDITNVCSSVSLTPDPIAQQTYTIGRSSLLVNFNPWIVGLTQCGTPTFTTLSLSTGLALDSSFITFNTASRTFTITSSSVSIASLSPYTVQLTGVLPQGVQKQVQFDILLMDPCSIALLTGPSFGDIFLKTGQPPLLIPITTVSSTESQLLCGTISYSLNVYDNSQIIVTSSQTFLTSSIGSMSMSLQLLTLSEINSSPYTIQIKSQQGTYSTAYITRSFQVQMACIVYKLFHEQLFDSENTTMDIINYKIGDPLIKIRVLRFTKDNLSCSQQIKYSLSLTSGAAVPSFIILDDQQTDLYVKVFSNLKKDAMVPLLTIVITGTLDNPDNTQTQTQVRIPLMIDYENIGAPIFVEPLDILVLKMNEPFNFKFPRIRDPDGDRWSLVSLDLGPAKSFINETFPILRFLPTPSTTLDTLYTLKVTLQDDNPRPLSATYPLILQIVQSSVNSSTSSLNNQISSLITSSNQDEVRHWNRFNKGINKKPLKNPLQFRALIRSVSQEGLVSIEFTKMIQVPTNITQFNNQTMMIKVKSVVKNANDTFEERKIVTWNTTKITASQMLIQIQFENPIKISPSFVRIHFINFFKDYDSISIQYLQENMIISSDLTMNLDPLTILQGTVPPQIPQSLLATLLDKSSIVASNAITATLSSNMLLATLAGLSMKKLWSMISSLQIIVHYPMLKIPIAPNLLKILNSVVEIVNMGLIPKQYVKQIINKISKETNIGKTSDSKLSSVDIFLTL